MAITQRTEQHFDPEEFDSFIAAHGSDAVWRRARTCPCLDASTRQPSVACPFCRDWPGILWDAGTELRILAPNRQRRDEYEQPGLVERGMLFLTFPSRAGTGPDAISVTPGHLDRIDLSGAAEMVVNDEVHVRGDVDPGGRSTERLRLHPSLAVEFCEAIVGGTLTTFVEGTAFTVATNGAITWISGPPNGTQYTLRYRARPSFVVWSPMSRDEGGTKQPYRVLAQRLDFWRRQVVGE